MKAMLIVLAALLVVLVLVAHHRGVLQAGLHSSGVQLLKLAPILVVAIVIAGFVEVLLPQPLVERWLSDAAGWRGIALAWIAGVLTPAGSLIGLPLVAGLWRAGVGVGVLVTYMTSFATLSLIRLPLEVGLIGWRLAVLRVAVSIVLPPVAGLLARLIAPVLIPG